MTRNMSTRKDTRGESGGHNIPTPTRKEGQGKERVKDTKVELLLLPRKSSSSQSPLRKQRITVQKVLKHNCSAVSN